MTAVLAVDFGGTKTALARVDEHGEIAGHCRFPAARSVAESVALVADACAAESPVAAVGVIIPGIFTPETGRAWCPNLWGSDEVELQQALEAQVKVPVVIDSDRSGYVLGEAWLGAARGLRHVVFVSIGTGIGVGILSDGALVRGAHGIAGAAGWFALDPDWRDVYRDVGCWEAESAGPAIARLACVQDAAAAVARARAGDRDALDVLRRAARYSAMGIANLISALNPEAVVLGGGLIIGASELLLDPIRTEVPRWAQPIAASRCRIELSQLGDHAGLLGAARLALSLDAR